MIGTRFEGIVQNVRDSPLEFIDRQARPHKYLLNQLRHRDFLGGGLPGFAVGHGSIRFLHDCLHQRNASRVKRELVQFFHRQLENFRLREGRNSTSVVIQAADEAAFGDIDQAAIVAKIAAGVAGAQMSDIVAGPQFKIMSH